jgi:restriction system protein
MIKPLIRKQLFVMAIPDYQTLMLPVLKLASDQQEHKLREAVEQLADEFALSDDERNELLPSGSQAVFNNRVHWARTYLKQAGLLAAPKRGFFKITESGLSLLAENPDMVNVSLLERYPEFQEFRSRRKDKNKDVDEGNGTSTETPEDALASAYKAIRRKVEEEILDAIMQSSPSFFERLVVDLLVKMGYGGNRQDAGRALGRVAMAA